MPDQEVLRALHSVYRILEAGERGFATAANNIHNQGLKIIFKSYAQQRAEFKAEIAREIEKMGSNSQPSRTLLGTIHRGRIAIFGAMTSGDQNKEKVILKESLVGEKYAVRTYTKALTVRLPPDTRQILDQQFTEIRKVDDQLSLMLGKGGKRLVVWMFEQAQTADEAVASLQKAGIAKDGIDKISVPSSYRLYQGKGATVLETVLSGMFGGGLWGSISGAVVGIGAVQILNLETNPNLPSPLGIWVLVVLAGILSGAIIGGAFGLLIGLGISEEDTYQYEQSFDPGETIVKALVDEGRAGEAAQILTHTNLGSGAHASEAHI